MHGIFSVVIVETPLKSSNISYIIRIYWINEDITIMLTKKAKGRLIIVLFFAGTIYFTGFFFQLISEAFDYFLYPAPGKMVDVGKHSLHLNCSGKGEPTVILEHGLGWTSVEWSLVQKEVEKFTRVCSYDRAGYAWSEEGELPRTSERFADELHDLLKEAEVPPPYILVGHSYGGINVRVYADKYPDEVAGLVLVDPSHEKQYTMFPQGNRPESISWLETMKINLGYNRLLLLFSNQPDFVDNFSESDRRARFANLSSRKQQRTFWYEIQGLSESMRLVEEHPPYMGEKPLIVISAKQLLNADDESVSEEDKQNIEIIGEILRSLHQDLANQSDQGKLIIADESDHFVPARQPEIIVEAIREIVDSTRDH